MIKLYGRGQSRSFRGVWALNEAGRNFEFVPVSRDESWYPELNPQLKIPTLVDGAITLTESAAIVNYAGAGTPLVPADVARRARYDELCYFVMTELEQPLWSIGKHRFALPEEQRIDTMLDTALFEFDKAQRALHHHMDGRSYAVADEFTMADVLLAHTLNWALRFEMPVDDVFRDYRDRMYARPAAVLSLAQVA